MGCTFLNYHTDMSDELFGLDVESAEKFTPKWYAVSYGNGNDGVSHMFPDYYVRTCYPYQLATLAMVDRFKPDAMEWALDATQVDGEADYTIQAVIYNPPDDNEDRDHSHCDDGDDCDGCDQCEGDDMDYCSTNGAWMLADIFRVDVDDMQDIPQYDSISSAFSEQAMEICKE
jgi:hypothetical protein